MEIDELPENDERLLKKPEIKRDEMGRFSDDEITPQVTLKKPEIKRDPEGRFEKYGKALSKTQRKKTGGRKAVLKAAVMDTLREINKQPILDANNPQPELTIGTGKRGPGRPKGSQNKVTLALKEAILTAAEHAGGDGGMVGYLKTLAIENSSAFAGLLGKVLPSTLAMPETTGGKQDRITFERVIVWPDGRREIEGVTPKQLPAPSPLSVKNNDHSICVEKPSQNSANDDQ